MLRAKRKTADTIFHVFSLTRPGIEPVTFRTRGEHTNDLQSSLTIILKSTFKQQEAAKHEQTQ